MSEGVHGEGDGTMKYEELTPDLQKKARACKDIDEVLALAKSEGYELSEEELTSISGGSWCGEVCSEKDTCEHTPCEHIYIINKPGR